MESKNKTNQETNEGQKSSKEFLDKITEWRLERYHRLINEMKQEWQKKKIPIQLEFKFK